MGKLKNKRLREQFRKVVFERDGYSCRTCGNNLHAESLDAHHITDRKEMPNGGYVKDNGISLCPPCHYMAEEWHSSNGLEFVEGFHPDELYSLIGSSYEKAFEASLRLEI